MPAASGLLPCLAVISPGNGDSQSSVLVRTGGGTSIRCMAQALQPVMRLWFEMRCPAVSQESPAGSERVTTHGSARMIGNLAGACGRAVEERQHGLVERRGVLPGAGVAARHLGPSPSALPARECRSGGSKSRSTMSFGQDACQGRFLVSASTSMQPRANTSLARVAPWPALEPACEDVRRVGTIPGSAHQGVGRVGRTLGSAYQGVGRGWVTPGPAYQRVGGVGVTPRAGLLARRGGWGNPRLGLSSRWGG